MNIQDNQIERSINILIVEDSIINAQVLQDFLKSEGIQNILIAATGQKALHYFSQPLDLIITDFHLPDMNGIQITEHYQKNFPKKNTPIICCSTESEKIRKKCIEAGIDDFLPKPVSPQN